MDVAGWTLCQSPNGLNDELVDVNWIDIEQREQLDKAGKERGYFLSGEYLVTGDQEDLREAGVYCKIEGGGILHVDEWKICDNPEILSPPEKLEWRKATYFKRDVVPTVVIQATDR